MFAQNRAAAAAEEAAARAAFEQQQPSAIPPASLSALRQLPTIVVTPEDLVDPTNRECCICFEEYVLQYIIVYEDGTIPRIDF